MSPDSVIKYSKSSTAFVGGDAINLYAASLLWSHLKLYRDSKILPTRGVTLTGMLQLATRYTGQPYKKKEIDKAINDLDAWVKTMKAALPIEVKDD